jgi:L-cysteine:1D-myo-inositol 2-amino-2-deoxy-alpha-D-glucopyranoside ligase
MRELGTTIDLHGGGSDLIFPHHECEAAQSEAATGELFVRHWMHAPMVEYQGTKMSKSLGNLVFISELVKEWEPMAVRLAILDHSYRSPWVWEDGLLPLAAERLERWRPAGGEDASPEGASLEEVRSALDDDLDIPRAIRAIDDAAASGRGVRRAADLIGVALP